MNRFENVDVLAALDQLMRQNTAFYKSLCFTGMKDRHGLYAVIGKDENRDKEVRRPRASIRRQLSETKQAQASKKAPARTKKNELEV